MIYGNRSTELGSNKKCGHAFSNEDFLVNHQHDEDNGKIYTYCKICNSFVTIDDPIYHKDEAKEIKHG
jgi:hypothetical protein